MKQQPIPILALASARSGTSFLADFFRHHVLDCYSTHEPYLTPGNPVLFGKAIEWNTTGQDDQLLPLLEKKCAFIRSRREPVYFEANHAIAKAFDRHLPSLLPEARFIHLQRHPAAVAKSELLREQVIRRFRIPFIDYTSDRGERLFRWSLTGHETIYREFAVRNPGHTLTRFGFYVLQWFEVEYRIQQVLKHNAAGQVFCIDVERQLKDPATLKAMLDHFGLHYREPFTLDLHRNKTWFAGPSTLADAEEAEFGFIVQNLPEKYLDALIPFTERQGHRA